MYWEKFCITQMWYMSTQVKHALNNCHLNIKSLARNANRKPAAVVVIFRDDKKLRKSRKIFKKVCNLF